MRERSLECLLRIYTRIRKGQVRNAEVDMIDVGREEVKLELPEIYIKSFVSPDARNRGKCVYAWRARVNFRAISRQFPDFPSVDGAWEERGKRVARKGNVSKNPSDFSRM